MQRPQEISSTLGNSSSALATRDRHRQLLHSKLESIAASSAAPQTVYVVEEKATDAAAVLQYGPENAYKLEWHIDYNTTVVSSMRSEVESNIAYRQALRANYGTPSRLYRVRAINLLEKPWP